MRLNKDQCEDPTQEFNIHIPCGLADRVAAYAGRNGTTFTTVVIEALDVFLREQNHSVVE